MEIKFTKDGKCVGRAVIERFMIKGEVWPFYEGLPEKVEIPVKVAPKIEKGSDFKDDALVISPIDAWCYLLRIDPEYMKKIGVNAEVKKRASREGS